MTTRQKRQIELLNFMGAKEGLIDLRELILCACDTCREFKILRKSHEAYDWIKKHENHSTWVWFKGLRKTQYTVETKAATSSDDGKEKFLDKVKKLYQLAENTPYPEEAECAMLKAKKLIEEYELDGEDI